MGHEIGKAAAEKSRGLFSADDWQCGRYVAFSGKNVIQNSIIIKMKKIIILNYEYLHF